MKRRGDKIVMITAYDAPAARIADEAGVELILVGDTAAMVMLGHESTVPVTLDEMIFLTRAVTRAARRPLVIGDLPFGSYEISDEQAVGSAIRMVKEGGADVVKLEGAGRMLSRVRAIADSNIGVMGHVGLTPQSATKLGGFKAQGRTADAASSSTRTRSRCRTRAASRSSSRRCPRRSRRASPRRSTSRRSASAPAPATRRPGARVARPARPVRGPHAAVRQALRRGRRAIGDAVAQYAARRAQRRVPGGAAHVRDAEEELALRGDGPLGRYASTVRWRSSGLLPRPGSRAGRPPGALLARLRPARERRARRAGPLLSDFDRPLDDPRSRPRRRRLPAPRRAGDAHGYPARSAAARATLWLLTTVGLIAIYAVQETLEGHGRRRSSRAASSASSATAAGGPLPVAALLAARDRRAPPSPAARSSASCSSRSAADLSRLARVFPASPTPPRPRPARAGGSRSCAAARSQLSRTCEPRRRMLETRHDRAAACLRDARATRARVGARPHSDGRPRLQARPRPPRRRTASTVLDPRRRPLAARLLAVTRPSSSGDLGEPMLRIGPGGVWVNRRSITAVSEKLTTPGSGWTATFERLELTPGTSIGSPRRRGRRRPARSRGSISQSSARECAGQISGTFVRYARPSLWPWLRHRGRPRGGSSLRRFGSAERVTTVLGVLAGVAAVVSLVAFSVADAPNGQVAWVQIVSASGSRSRCTHCSSAPTARGAQPLPG